MVKQHVKATCPHCKTELKATIYDSIDANENYSEAKKVYSGEIFGIKCKLCRKTTRLNFPLLYTDKQNAIAIQYAHNEKNYDNALERVANIRLSVGNHLTGRVVSKQEHLMEKARIFKAGLDDRVIEILKLATYDKVKQDYPDIEIKDILFDSHANSYNMYISGSRELVLEISKDDYNKAKELYESHFTDEEFDNFIINRKWAERLMIKVDSE